MADELDVWVSVRVADEVREPEDDADGVSVVVPDGEAELEREVDAVPVGDEVTLDDWVGEIVGVDDTEAEAVDVWDTV